MTRIALKLASLRSRISMLGDRFDNLDGLAERYAADALLNERPAFWTNQKGHNARAGILLIEINRLGGIEAGIAQCVSDYPHTPASKWSEPASLDWLLPLNSAAATDLALAYKAAGTFRTRQELLRRADRAEGAIEVAA